MPSEPDYSAEVHGMVEWAAWLLSIILESQSLHISACVGELLYMD